MAIIDQGLPPIEPLTDEQEAQWKQWVSERPDCIKTMIETCPPLFYYDMPATGQIVLISGYNEDGTVSVLVVGDSISIPAMLPLEVFGVSISDLVRRDDPTRPSSVS